ncbi:MAG: hypothetical protein AB1465_05305 [Patescibacteria group bacterium]
MIYLWAGGLMDALFTVVICLPFLLYLIIASVNNGLTLNKTIGIALICFLMLNSISFALGIFLVILITFVLLTNSTYIKKNLRYLILLVLLTILLGSIFIVSMFGGIFFGKESPSKEELGLTGYIFLNGGMDNIFRFLFDWTINPGSYSNQDTFYAFTLSKIGTFSTFLLWIVIILIPLIIKNKLNNNKILIAIYIFILLSFFLTKGTNNPLGSLNLFLYEKVPFFGIFRTPGNKFALLILLSISLLIILSLNIIKNKKFTILVGILICLQTFTFFIYHPLFTPHYPSNNVAIPPKEYKDVINLINSDKNEGSVLFFPGYIFAYFDFKTQQKYAGRDILGRFLNRPVIYSDGAMEALFQKEYSRLVYNFDPTTVGSKSIRFIIIRNDFDAKAYKLNYSINTKLNILKNNPAYSNIYNSQLLSVFKLNENYYKNYITIKKNNKEIVPNFYKVSPSHYIVRLNSIELNNNFLVFRNIFKEGWSIMGLDKSLYNIEHINFHNSNAWSIIKKNNSPENSDDLIFHIFYLPNLWLYVFSAVSIISILFLILVIVRNYFIKK